MKEKLITEINKIRNAPSLLSWDEASIKAGVVQQLLSIIGWDPFDVNEVKPEYAVESRRVDFSLRIYGMNKVFIEVKRPNENLELHQRQLLEYSFIEGVKLAILTNGITWWFYLPKGDGNWEQRRFFTVNLSEQEPTSTAEMFTNLLSKENVASGDAIKRAEHLHEKSQRTKHIKEALPKAWYKIINDPDDLLVELLIETTANLSGFRPEISDIEEFLQKGRYDIIPKAGALTPPVSQKPTPPLRQSISGPAKDDYINKKVKSFTLLGKTYYPHSWKELLVTVSEEMYSRHAADFDRCLALRGSSMAYFSLNSDELKQPAQISDSRYFVETKLNSNSIVRRSRELISFFGHKETDLNVTAA